MVHDVDCNEGFDRWILRSTVIQDISNRSKSRPRDGFGFRVKEVVFCSVLGPALETNACSNHRAGRSSGKEGKHPKARRCLDKLSPPPMSPPIVMSAFTDTPWNIRIIGSSASCRLPCSDRHPLSANLSSCCVCIYISSPPFLWFQE